MDEVGPDALRLLTVDDVVAILQVSTRQGYRLLQSGSIDSFKVGRALRCTRLSVANYIEEREAIHAGQPPALIVGLDAADYA